MNLRIQTYGEPDSNVVLKLQLMGMLDEVSVYTVLEKGLEDLMAICDVVERKFTIARDDFVNKMDE